MKDRLNYIYGHRQRKKLTFALCIFLLAAFAAAGCGGVKEILQKDSPHDKYEKSLEQVGLLQAALGREWKKAGERVLNDTLKIKLPFKESGYFFSDRADASSYNFEVRRGEKIVIRLERDTVHKMAVFIDLFAVEGLGKTRSLKRVAYAEDNQLSIEEDVNKNQMYLLRIQPELMNGGRYILTITGHPSLAFPVVGKNGKAIGSRFGDGRDGGKRRHEGVDIFAPKRNPVVAVTDGLVTRITEGGIGGKVVWMTNIHNQNFYYAHLDSQLVHPGEIVKEGEVLGLIGNTGNAKYSPSHLHFGLYLPGEGAVDPYPFINDMNQQPADVSVDENSIGIWARVKSTKALLKDSPDSRSKIIEHLSINTPLEIYGGTMSYYRVKLPDNTSGFIESKYLEKAEGLRYVAKLDKNRPVFDAPEGKGVLIEYLPERTNLKIYGEYKGFYLVKDNDAWGWVSK